MGGGLQIRELGQISCASRKAGFLLQAPQELPVISSPRNKNGGVGVESQGLG